MKTQKSFSETKVHEIMTRQVQTVMIDDTIKDAVDLMLDHKLTAVPVVDADNKCTGILSSSDLTEFFLNEDDELSRVLDTERLSMDWVYRSLDTSDVRQVKEMMTHDVTQIGEDENLPAACKKMAKKQVHHLPVVDSQGRLKGILSSFDVVEAVAEHG